MESNKKIGDAVVINFGESGLLRNCFVHAVKFTESKVLYDLKIYPYTEDYLKEIFFILPDIDSFFIEKPTDRFTGDSNMPFQQD